MSSSAGPPGIPGDPFDLLGQVLDGQFRIDEVVGEGGQSVVYRGEHVGFDAKVAIKCLKLQTQLAPPDVESFMRRFRDEGRVAYRLSQGHFHIVRCMAIGTTLAPKSGALVPYTVLEWLDGQSLARQFEERRAAGGQGRPLGDLIELLDSAAQAIGYAHEQGVAHRDLHPGSIFLARTREGITAKVLDFGLAKITQEHVQPEVAHRTFRVFSPAYAAPEQFDEVRAGGPVGTWTDVYSLAMVLLEGMRDQPPFLGVALPELIAKTLDPAVRATPRAFRIVVTDEIEAIFARALALSPTERIPDVTAFWSALKEAARAGASLPHLAPASADSTQRMESIDATQRMDALPDSDVTPDQRTTFPALEPADASLLEKQLLDEETTIDERLDPQIAAARMAAAPEISGVHASSAAEGAVAEGSADFTGPRKRTHSADYTGGHHALSPEATGPRQGIAGDAKPGGRSSVVLAVLLGAGAAVLALVGLTMLYLHSSAEPRTESSAAAPGTGMATKEPEPEPPAPPAPRATASASASASSPSGSVEAGSPRARPPARPGKTPKAASPVAEPVEVPAPADLKAFNPMLAQASLRVLDPILASCKRPDGTGGEGTVQVTFDNNGSVSAVDVSGPLADAPEGACVAARYKRAKVPPFEGAPGVVEHAFRLPK